jgi:NAD(P)-dependent dehydrogenase (short-subunit alcohol dehydrogenase family)
MLGSDKRHKTVEVEAGFVAHGTIITPTSVGIASASPGTSLYMAMVAMTRVLAPELAPPGIIVNVRTAGLSDTERTRQANSWVPRPISRPSPIPLTRAESAEEVADVAPGWRLRSAGLTTSSLLRR